MAHDQKRRRAGEIWYAAEGHKLTHRGCCLWNIVVPTVLLYVGILWLQ